MPMGRMVVPLRPVKFKPADKAPADLAVNVGVPDGPKGSASSTTSTPEGDSPGDRWQNVVLSGGGQWLVASHG